MANNQRDSILKQHISVKTIKAIAHRQFEKYKLKVEIALMLGQPSHMPAELQVSIARWQCMELKNYNVNEMTQEEKDELYNTVLYYDH